MPIAPLRDLGSLGVITDVDPYDLPPTAFSMGVNARFEDKRISRGPVFRTVAALAGGGTNPPQFVISYKPLTGTPKFDVCYSDGSIVDWSVSAPGGTPTATNILTASSTFASPWTALINNNIIYVNRPDRVPYYMAVGGATFATLPIWDATWRCQVLRSVGAALIAINVTKGATSYPTMIKTSDFTTFGNTPPAWTAATTNSASENVLPDLQEPLIDGHPLRSYMVLYSNNETWVMTRTGDNNVWAYERLFGGPDEARGVIGVNCVVQNNNTHYVMGINDIWEHDGIQHKSISAGSNRDFIYGSMVKAQANQFFALHNPKLNEVMFCYLSSDPYCTYPVGGAIGYPGCNRAAVYNYRANTWYYYDLPYINGAGITVPFQGLHYSDETTTSYTVIGGTYQSFSDSSKLALTTVGAQAGPVTQAVRTFELTNSPNANGPMDTAANGQVFIAKAGLDMDDLGKQLRMYGVVNSIYPEGRFDPGAQPLTFRFGASDYSSSPAPVLGPPMTFDGSSNYKLDYTVTGRYLTMQITYPDTKNFTLSGLDFDMSIIGKR